MSEETARYTSVAIGLHWLIAVLILGQIAGGLYMADLPFGQEKFALYQTHKSFGITILFLSVIRLGWRLTHQPPALPEKMKNWERIAARATHLGFYGLMIGIPLGGWAVVSASPLAESVPTLLFGFIPWPHLPFFADLQNRQEVTDALSQMHSAAAYGVLFLLVLHLGAALQHQFIKRDQILLRMLPGFGRKS
ncbi:MAG: cytochrome b [Pseudomonadota bacterium]